MNPIRQEILEAAKGVFRLPNFLPKCLHQAVIWNTLKLSEEMPSPSGRMHNKFQLLKSTDSKVAFKTSSTLEQHLMVFETKEQHPTFMRDIMLPRIEKAVSDQVSEVKTFPFDWDTCVSINLKNEDPEENSINRYIHSGLFKPRPVMAIYSLGPSKITCFDKKNVLLAYPKGIPIDPNMLVILKNLPSAPMLKEELQNLDKDFSKIIFSFRMR